MRTASAGTSASGRSLSSVMSDAMSEGLLVHAAFASGTVLDVLHLLNRPDRLAANLAPYLRWLLPIADGEARPGADAVAGWYRRNLHIAANLLNLLEASP